MTTGKDSRQESSPGAGTVNKDTLATDAPDTTGARDSVEHGGKGAKSRKNKSGVSRNSPLKRSFGKRFFYRGVRLVSQYIGVLVFQLRCHDREKLMGAGGALILSTHQSHFDPVLIGVTFNERLNYLARRSLFKNRIFGAAISLLDAIELDRDRSGLAGLKETLQRLKRGEKVLIFPEGTRTSDGEIAPLKPGFLAVARRSKVPMIPIAITGAFDALPKGSRLPVRHPLRVVVGDEILASDLAALDDGQALELVRSRLVACFNYSNSDR